MAANSHRVPQPPQATRDTSLRDQYLVLRDEEPWGKQCRDAARLHQQAVEAEAESKRQKAREYRRQLEEQMANQRKEKELNHTKEVFESHADREASILAGMSLENAKDSMKQSHLAAQEMRRKQLEEVREAHAKQRAAEDAVAHKLKEEAERMKQEEREAALQRKAHQREVALETARTNNEMKKQHLLQKKAEQQSEVEALRLAMARDDAEQKYREEEQRRRQLPRLVGPFVPAADPFASPKYQKYFSHVDDRPLSTRGSPRSARNRKLSPQEVKEQLQKQIEEMHRIKELEREKAAKERELVDQDTKEHWDRETQRQIITRQRQRQYSDDLRNQLISQRRREHESIARGEPAI